ncbi:MAG: phasin family protein [Hyphomicrobium sp.]
MIEQITKSIASPFTQMPNPLMPMFQDNLAKTREVAKQSITAAKERTTAMVQAIPGAQVEARTLTEKAFDQAIENTDAAFIAAQAIAKAQTPFEVAQIQANYMQTQISKSSEQVKELFDLWGQAAQKSLANSSASFFGR